MLFRRQSSWPSYGWVNPFQALDRLSREIDSLSGRQGSTFAGMPLAGVFPLTNVTEDKDNYYVRAELPGLKADELDISVTGDSLSISGERKLPVEDQNAQYHRREREAGRFNRMISLPGQLDPDKVKASCTDGVLTVTLPKAEASKPRQISVKAS